MKKIRFCILMVIMFIFLTGCSSENKRTLEEKIDAEIEYMQDIIFTISNKHAKKEYIEEDKINWEEIKKDIQKLDNSWITLSLDLGELNIDNEKIINCSAKIEDVLILVGNKDDINLLINIQKIYENMIELKNDYSEDKNLIKKMKIKDDVFKIYNLSYQNNYDLAKSECLSLKKYYNELMNDENYTRENNYNLNKVYILIEELDSSVQKDNMDLIRMRFLNLIEKM